MDGPSDGTHNGPRAALERRSRAIARGSVFDVGGSPIEVVAPHPALAMGIARLLLECPVTEAAPVGHLRWTASDEPPPLPSRADLRWPDLSVWLGVDSTTYRHDVAVGVVCGSEVELFGTPSDPRLVFRRLFLFLAGHLLGAQNRFLVHAAAVGRGDRTMLVLGESGAGKSTLVAAAHAAGWRILADDLVVIDSDGDTVRASGVPRPIAVPGDVARQASGAIDGDPRQRVELEPGVHDLGAHVVTDTIVVGHSAGAGSISDLDAARALHAAIGVYSCGHVDSLLRRFFPLAGRLSRLPTHRLDLAIDPARRLDVAGSHLDRLSSSITR